MGLQDRRQYYQQEKEGEAVILKIDYDERQVISKESGQILLHVKYYAQYAAGAHLATTKGETKEDFEKNKGRSSKTVFIGNQGGISIG